MAEDVRGLHCLNRSHAYVGVGSEHRDDKRG